MDHSEMVNLLRGGVIKSVGVWADFGAGQGNFTHALRDLVGQDAVIHAVDQDQRALCTNTFADVHHRVDFTVSGALDGLPLLDGILMTNALHWVRDQQSVVNAILNRLTPDGRLLLVEYDTSRALPYIPYPVPFSRFEQLAGSVGFNRITQIATRKSPRSGIGMYSALAEK